MRMKFTFKSLLLAAGLLVGSNAWAEEADAVVRMTYVNGSDDSVDTSYGEIAAGSTALTGYNKVGSSVDLANKGWNVNCITYLQVDASSIPGTITGATLTFEGSGPTDSGKRNAVYGVGYNTSEWSADMTYNTADRSITLIGETQSNNTNSATSFVTCNFNVIDALKNDEDKIVTILVYATSAAGGYVKNPKVTVIYTTETAYDVTFKETNDVKATITIDGSDVTNGTTLPAGTYTFKATADGYYDYEDQFEVENAALEVSFTMEAKPVYSYTVTSSYNGNTLAWSVTGTAYEGQVVTIWYPRYQADGKTLVGRAPVSNNNNLTTTITVTEDGYTTDLEYQSEGIDNLYLLSEAEDLETGLSTGATSFTDRVSNKQIIYGASGTLLSLPAGKYIFTLGAIGAPNNSSCEYTVSAGDQQIISGACTGNTLTLLKSEEFTIYEETAITFTGTNQSSSRGIDLVYVQKTGDVAIELVSSENLKGYKTFYNASASYEVDENTSIYKAAVNGDVVVLTEVEGNVVPAGNAVLLQTTADDYTITLTPTAEEGTGDFNGNELEAADAEGVQANAYILARTNEKELAFYKYEGSLKVGDVYLPIANSQGIKSFAIAVEGTATAVETVEAENEADGALYNVAGQQVGSDYKGIVIKNGKKYLNK